MNSIQKHISSGKHYKFNIFIVYTFLFSVSCVNPKEQEESKTLENIFTQKSIFNDSEIENFNFYNFYTPDFLNTFSSEIKKFKEMDSIQMPEQNQILFVGSSSIRLWKNLESEMAPLRIIKRGFGGSTLPQVIHHINDIVIPYHPTAIVLYAGENDLTAETNTPNWTYKMFRYFVYLIRKDLPECRIYYISIKPSPSRFHLYKKMILTNFLIKQYCQSNSDTKYIDVANMMLNDDGRPISDIFIKDSLHLNEKGYQLWTSIIKSEVIKYELK